MAPAQQNYTLIAKDGTRIVASETVCKMSEVLKDMIQYCTNSQEVEIGDIDGDVLQVVIDFCRNYEKEPEYVPPKAGAPENTIPDESRWDQQYLKRPNTELMKIVHAANYLNIQRLIDSYCYRLHNDLKGKSVDELREIFRE